MNMNTMSDTAIVHLIVLRVRDMLNGSMYQSSYESAMIERLEHASNLLARIEGETVLLAFPVPDGMTVREAGEMAASA